MTQAPEMPKLKPCPVCHGRGYINCECWPGDCICGDSDRDCEQCHGEGWIDPLEDEDDAFFAALEQGARRG